MTSAPPTATKLANPKSQLTIRLWGQIIAISETLRRIISNLWAAFRDFLELKIIFPINYASTDVVGAYIIYRKYYFEF